MEFGLTTGRRVKKAESNLASYQVEEYILNRSFKMRDRKE